MIPVGRGFCLATLLRRLIAVAPVILTFVVPGGALAQVAATPSPSAAPDLFGRKYPARVYQTVRLDGKPPAIDGRLDDQAWKQGEWSGDYTQQTPTEGAPPSQPTELKILYDDSHIYFAIRVYDDPKLVQRQGSRRDDFNSYAVDIVGICFDSYNDKRTGFEFDLTAGGAKIDLVLGNGETEWDTTWDAVWDGEVAHDEKGWTAEVGVPLSQLRYGPQDEQVWGIHAWRWIARNQEEDQWQLIPRLNTGRMYQLGELRGIRGLPRSRHVELLPHALGRASKGPSVSEGGTTGSGGVGFDAKIGLTSNFTVDATVNPDFGQVEADPSVINLTAYETFYEEKRPFFLEGRKILTFEIEDDGRLFHSRRIGEMPSYSPPLGAGETATIPESTSILGALKATGKTNGGLSVAALQSFTQKETIDITGAAGGRQVAVEPFGSYAVGRLHKDWGKGNTSLGGMLTSSHRWIPDATLAFLPNQATTGGLDFSRFFASRTWFLEASAVFSHVTGAQSSIQALQTNAVHYFQRVDAGHLGVDPLRTSLAGHGGAVSFSRSGSSRLQVGDGFHWYSPGLDLNDVGYLRQADLIANRAFVGWSEPTPRGIFRDYEVQLAREDNWDFGGLQTAARTLVQASAQFTNRWRASASAALNRSVDTRALRGGPALRESDFSTTSVGISTDSARRTFLSVSAARQKASDGETGAWQASGTLRWRPTNRVVLTANAGYTRSTDDLQYVAAAKLAGGSRWVLGRIDQKVWSLTFRANVSITPELTVQYYGSPFIGSGLYSDFKQATTTLARIYEDRFHRYSASELTLDPDADRYQIAEGVGGMAYSFANPDFSFRQFRSNLVVRWEFKPGSTLYAVWSQGRTSNEAVWNGEFRRNWNELWRAAADNVFLVKLSYWLAR